MIDQYEIEEHIASRAPAAPARRTQPPADDNKTNREHLDKAASFNIPEMPGPTGTTLTTPASTGRAEPIIRSKTDGGTEDAGTVEAPMLYVCRA